MKKRKQTCVDGEPSFNYTDAILPIVFTGIFCLSLIILVFLGFEKNSTIMPQINKANITFSDIPEGLSQHELLIEKSLVHVFWDVGAVPLLNNNILAGFPLSFRIHLRMDGTGIHVNRGSSCGNPNIDNAIDNLINQWNTNQNSCSCSYSGYRNNYSLIDYDVIIFPGISWMVQVNDIQLQEGANPGTGPNFYAPSYYDQYWFRCLPVNFGAAQPHVSYSPAAQVTYNQIVALYQAWRAPLTAPIQP